MNEMIQSITGQGIVCLFEDAQEVIASLCMQHNTTVWYLGEFADRFIACEEFRNDRVDIGELGAQLDHFADQIEPALLKLDDFTKKQVKNSLSWDVSIVSDLSPYVGNLQVNIARFLHVRNCLKQGGMHLFLVDSARFGEMLANAGVANKLDIQWRGEKTFPPSYAQRFRARLSAIKTAVTNKLSLFRLRKQYPTPWERLKKCDVLVFDWAELNTYKAGEGIQWSRNLRRVPGIYQEAGCNVGFIFSPLAWAQSYSDIAKDVCSSDAAALLVDECRPVSEVLRGVWASFRLSKQLVERLEYDGLDLGAFIKLAKEQDAVSAQASLAYGFKAIARTLAKKGCYPKAVIHPYEHQGWERALYQGMREHLPQTKIVAYQFAPFADRYLSFYPFSEEIKNKSLPDRLICSGTHFVELFTRRGFPPERIDVGGTVMYEEVIKLAKEKKEFQEERSGTVVLCTTPIKYSEALNITDKVIRAAQEVGEVKVVVNFHPATSPDFRINLIDMIGKRYAGYMEYIEFSTEQARKLLEKIDAVFYNTSGTAFDAMLYKLPVFYIPVDGSVNQNKLPPSMSKDLKDHDALCDVLHGLKSNDKSLTTEIDEKQLSECLIEVQEQVFLDAID